jgi:hypothetical protein
MKAPVTILANLGSEQIDHQHTHPGGGAGAASVALASPDKNEQRQVYFCRGCGIALPEGFRGHFHKDCLRADKQRRVRNRRRQEGERFAAWAQRINCPHCGNQYGESPSDHAKACPREASQGPKDGGAQD